MREIVSNLNQPGLEVSAFDTASYVYQFSKELAEVAERAGLSQVAAALELTRTIAAEALATMATKAQSKPSGAAPEDAA